MQRPVCPFCKSEMDQGKVFRSDIAEYGNCLYWEDMDSKGGLIDLKRKLILPNHFSASRIKAARCHTCDMTLCRGDESEIRHINCISCGNLMEEGSIVLYSRVCWENYLGSRKFLEPEMRKKNYFLRLHDFLTGWSWEKSKGQITKEAYRCGGCDLFAFRY